MLYKNCVLRVLLTFPEYQYWHMKSRRTPLTKMFHNINTKSRRTALIKMFHNINTQSIDINTQSRCTALTKTFYKGSFQNVCHYIVQTISNLDKWSGWDQLLHVITELPAWFLWPAPTFDISRMGACNVRPPIVTSFGYTDNHPSRERVRKNQMH